jgi:hypothetical protein
MDLATGTRRQITHLSGAAAPYPNPAFPVTWLPGPIAPASF